MIDFYFLFMVYGQNEVERLASLEHITLPARSKSMSTNWWQILTQALRRDFPESACAAMPKFP
jgi:hypothetical protein